MIAAGAMCAAVIVVICIWPDGEQRTPENRKNLETVESVIDGDTIVLTGGDRVRLSGIEAPPLNARDGSGRKAREFLENICPPGTPVRVEPDDLAGMDRYGRLLAVVYACLPSGDVNLNAEMLKSGNATVLIVPPTKFNPYLWITENC